MKRALVTGGAGFFGTILRDTLLAQGWTVVSIDLVEDSFVHERYSAVQGDISDHTAMQALFSTHAFDVIFHLAAILNPDVLGKNFLWRSNVDGTREVAECAKKYSVPKVIFVSTICLWGSGFGKPVSEDEPPTPIDWYGKSKWEGEKILKTYEKDFDAIIFRCPPVIDAGRLGLLSILFEFIEEGRKVWVVGGGDNTYQFIYGTDLADACIRAVEYKGSDVFNIGSDNVHSFRKVYESVIERTGTRARVASLPRGLAIFLMKLAYALRLSPLGPYQYKMIAENFVFDTTKVKQKLGWHPTLTNEDMLWKSYEFWRANRKAIATAQHTHAHKRNVKMGIIRLLKWIS
jgi:UDP-glucose 4-epimerase